MNGYATQTADEHEDTATWWAELADDYRGEAWNGLTLRTRALRIRQCQNLAVMHYEDAQRIRNQA
jgi:hypothetical protein